MAANSWRLCSVHTAMPLSAARVIAPSSCCTACSSIRHCHTVGLPPKISCRIPSSRLLWSYASFQQPVASAWLAMLSSTLASALMSPFSRMPYEWPAVWHSSTFSRCRACSHSSCRACGCSGTATSRFPNSSAALRWRERRWTCAMLRYTTSQCSWCRNAQTPPPPRLPVPPLASSAVEPAPPVASSTDSAATRYSMPYASRSSSSTPRASSQVATARGTSSSSMSCDKGLPSTLAQRRTAPGPGGRASTSSCTMFCRLGGMAAAKSALADSWPPSVTRPLRRSQLAASTA
mmetsp:Transcript_30577/g.76505  ORF Transcript_30577/g.76505 Transcript_30577/m.76505 type:complete len:291 (+) Transcript_30577:570-1442(+)